MATQPYDPRMYNPNAYVPPDWLSESDALPPDALTGDPSGGGGGDPTGGGAMPPSTGMGIYGNPSQPISVSGQYGGTPTLNTDPNQDIHNMFYNDQALIAAGYNNITGQVQGQLGYYGPRQQQYGQLSDTALSDLQKTPGYTDQEASVIGQDYAQNRTSQDDLNKQFLSPWEQQYSYLTPGEQQSIFGDPSRPEQVMGSGTAAEGAMLNAYQANLGSAVDQYGQNLSGEVGNFQSWTGGAVDQYGNKLDTAVSDLKSAAANPALAFDPNSTEKQLTDSDVQAMKTAAGERVGNEYRSAIDDLNRRAAAAGNTSPLAIAAARTRLEAQEGAAQGSAEYQADIAAKQAQFTRAADIEAQREGAARTQTGFNTQAAAAGIGAAENFGQTRVGAAEAMGQAGINAANQFGQARIGATENYGQNSLATTSNMANQNYAAAATEDAASSARAAQIAQNRQQTLEGIAQNRQNVQANINQTQYGQGMQTQQANSQGQQIIGGARMAGQGQYRAGVAQQQGMAQQGGQTAIGQQLGAYGTMTGGLNQSTNARANYENSGPGGFGKMGSQIFGAGMSLLGADKGAIITEPTLAVIAEKKPEMVMPLGRYRDTQKERVAA